MEFKKSKIVAMQTISEQVFREMKIEVGSTCDIFTEQELVMKLTGYVYENMAEERDLVYYCERPKFLDWILRREKKVVFHLQVKDLLLNPKPKNTERIYLTTLK